MFGLRSVCRASFLQARGGSGRCEWLVPTFYGKAHLRRTIEGLSLEREPLVERVGMCSSDGLSLCSI